MGETPRSNGQDSSSASASASTSTSTSTSISSVLHLTPLYESAVQTSSYNHIWSTIHNSHSASSSSTLHVLQPDPATVDRVLLLTRPTQLTRLVSDYFTNSELASRLCLHLQRSIDQTRSIYAPIGDLLLHLPSPSSSFSQSHFDWAYDTFFEFYGRDNPFPSQTHFRDVRLSFSDLRVRLDRLLHNARIRTRLAHFSTHCSAVCLFGAVIGVVISAVVIASHALATLVAAPLFIFPWLSSTEKQLHHISQLHAAVKGTYVLHDLDTIDCLIRRLHDAIESDRFVVKYVIEHGRERYPIVEVVNRLHKNHTNFMKQLEELEEHVCLCLANVNRTRSFLLDEMYAYQMHNSQHRRQQRWCYSCLG